MRCDQYQRLGRRGCSNSSFAFDAIVLDQLRDIVKNAGSEHLYCQVLAQAGGFAEAADIGRWAKIPGIVRLGPESLPTLSYQASFTRTNNKRFLPLGQMKAGSAVQLYVCCYQDTRGLHHLPY